MKDNFVNNGEKLKKKELKKYLKENGKKIGKIVEKNYMKIVKVN